MQPEKTGSEREINAAIEANRLQLQAIADAQYEVGREAAGRELALARTATQEVCFWLAEALRLVGG